MNKQRFFRENGFTLVELLIVVVILSVLAAIVVPQFKDSTTDAKQAALDSTLSGIRGAIALYYMHHQHYPSGASAAPAAAGNCGGTSGSDGAGTPEAFIEQLTRFTNADGGACSIGDDVEFKYGPYYTKNALPPDPIGGTINTLTVVTVGDLNMPADAASEDNIAGGWKYDNQTGKFIMNHPDYGER